MGRHTAGHTSTTPNRSDRARRHFVQRHGEGALYSVPSHMARSWKPSSDSTAAVTDAAVLDSIYEDYQDRGLVEVARPLRHRQAECRR